MTARRNCRAGIATLRGRNAYAPLIVPDKPQKMVMNALPHRSMGARTDG